QCAAIEVDIDSRIDSLRPRRRSHDEINVSSESKASVRMALRAMPLAVRVTFGPDRMKRGRPIEDSRFPMARLMAGWVMPSSVAAREKFPWRAAASKAYRMWPEGSLERIRITL